MLRLTVALSLLCLASASKIPSEPNQDRVVNGYAASILDHPFVCLIQLYGQQLCGSSILNKVLVVSAAHCFDKVKESDIPHLSVRCGSAKRNAGGIVRDVVALKVHEGFSMGHMMNDIALLELATPITYDHTMQPVTLPSTLAPEGTSCRVCGWGRMHENIIDKPINLQSTDVKLLTKETCSSNRYDYGRSVMQTMICGIGDNTDACKGDSGGPLVSNENDLNELIGIVSWGTGCNRPYSPGVYTNVLEMKPWILSNAKQLLSTP